MAISDTIQSMQTNLSNAYDKISDKGGTLPQNKNLVNLEDAIDSIPAGGGTVSEPMKDVNFLDYDGTIVASYTASDFANLTALPDNPSHDGLTAQGWNWTLANAKTYVATYGKLNIGQMYVTTDGKTRIYIELHEGRLSPYLGFAVNGTAIVDWGDGSATQTITGTSTSTVISTLHNYAKAGDYVITLTPSSGTIYLLGNSTSYSQLLWKNSTTGDLNRVYQNAIQKIEIGSNTSIGDYAFYGCYSPASITIPSSVTSIGGRAFYGCYSLASITIPSSVTSIGDSVFYNCTSLASITIPSSVTSIGDSVFRGCYSLAGITIPSSVTSIGNSVFYSCYSLASISIPSGVTSIGSFMFYNCYGMAYYDFTHHTSVPTLSSSNAFTGIPADCKIVVPDSLYNSWRSATNWSTYASYIIKASEWVR